jgi:multicomponent Na+:H+ antiporter subunit D
MAISAFPLFSAFITKSMVMTSMLEQGYTWLWPFLLFASAGVLEHAGIKIPYFAFFAHDSGIRAKEPPRNMLIAMFIGAVLCVVIGTFPSLLYSILPYTAEYYPYDLTHVVTQTQILVFGALAVLVLIRAGLYPPELPSVNIDIEWVYRRMAPRVVRTVGSAVARVDGAVRSAIIGVVGSAIAAAEKGHGPRGVLARNWPTGSMVLWVAILLGAYLIFYL